MCLQQPQRSDHHHQQACISLLAKNTILVLVFLNLSIVKKKKYDRKTRQKIGKDIKLNKTIKQQDSIPPVTEEHKFFTSTHGTVTKKRIPGHKLNSNKS